MRKTFGNWPRIIAVSLLVGVPLGFVVGYLYRKLTALPKEITIAAGNPGARYFMLSQGLAKEIETKLKVKVHFDETGGSLENLALLHSRKADFALYPGGALEILQQLDPDSIRKAGLPESPAAISNLSFVATLESQPAHIIVRHGAGINTPTDLKGKIVNIGPVHSGSYALSLLLLKHFGLNRDSIQVMHLNYSEIKKAFADAAIDAAFMPTGVQAPIFSELAETGKCSILSIPHTEAIAAKYVGMSQYKIPMGIYRSQPPAAPASDIQTVAFRTQLLTRADVRTKLVEEVTKIVLSEDFMKKSGLGELYAKGRQFAQQSPDFPMHPGARGFYNPELRPLLPADFMAVLEHLRSFVFSIAVSMYVVYQWFRRKKEHKLDKYVKEVLAIEQEARCLTAEGTRIIVDREPCKKPEEGLLELLERTDCLKHQALQSFTVQEINQELAISCFIRMCDNLADKINTRISRLKLHKRFDEISVVSSGEQ